MSSAYLNINAWREVLARLFPDVEPQTNVSPDWLVNPATRRRLKLDYLYPEIGVAIRFAGLTAKGQGRRSDWEVLEDQQRDQTRVELCRLNGVQLAVVDPFDDPGKQMDGLLRVLSTASRLLAQSNGKQKQKQQGMDALGRAHQRATRLRARFAAQPDQTIATLAEAWRDREAGLATELQQASQVHQSAPSPLAQEQILALEAGQRVAHSHHGEGVVVGTSGEGADQQITILFDAEAERERTFLLKLVTDKLRPLQ